MSEDAKEELMQLSQEWDRAMIGNDAEEIGRFMADGWVIVGSDGKVISKAAFLALVKSGMLSHNVMTTEEMDVRVYGDSAVTIARGVSGGAWQGQAFREVERVSCVFVRQEEQWRCVLTHLSRLAGANAG